jgi:hypothetical protein
MTYRRGEKAIESSNEFDFLSYHSIGLFFGQFSVLLTFKVNESKASGTLQKLIRFFLQIELTPWLRIMSAFSTFP